MQKKYHIKNRNNEFEAEGFCDLNTSPACFQLSRRSYTT